MKYKLSHHRCFTIPKKKLDLFLVALRMNFSDSLVRHEVFAVFQSEKKGFYDVIVSVYGSYGYLEREAEEFAKAL